jgi:hypothetical protein
VIYFTIRRETHAVGVDGTIEAGLWAIDATGANLRPVILIDDVRDRIGAEVGDLVTSADILTMDISATAERVVYTVKNASTSEQFVLTALGSGSEVQVVHGPTPSVTRATISGNGSTVFVADVDPNDPTRTVRFLVLGSGGEFRREIEPVVVGGATVAEKGLMLSEDGTLLLAGNTGAMIYTVDGVVRWLTPNCPMVGQIPVTLEGATMGSQGYRVAYLAPVVGGNRLVVMDVMTDDTRVKQAALSVTIEPPVIVAGEPDAATLTVDVGDPAARACVTLWRDSALLTGAFGLNDTGVEGDDTAGDGVFTTGRLAVPAGTDGGEVVVRIAFERMGPDGLRTTELYDIAERLKVR